MNKRSVRIRWLILVFVALQMIAAAEAAPRVRTNRESFFSGQQRITTSTYIPEGRERLPAVLVLHSAAGTLIGKRELERFSRAMAERGFAVFLVRYFDRTGTVFANDRDIARHTDAWMETVRDAVGHASRHPRVNADSIGLFGYSLGAYLAVTESSLDARIDAVAEVAGGVFHGYEMRMRRLPPTLILHGSRDQRVPVTEAREIQRAARRFGARTRVKIYEGEGHRLSRAASRDATQRAIRFLSEHLR